MCYIHCIAMKMGVCYMLLNVLGDICHKQMGVAAICYDHFWGASAICYNYTIK